MEGIDSILDNLRKVEQAESAKREAAQEVVKAAKEFCETLHIDKNEPPVPVIGKLKVLADSVNKLNNIGAGSRD